MHIIKADLLENNFSTCYYLNDRFYIRQKNVGLGEIVSDHFHLVPGGEAFAQLHIFAMLPKEKDEIIIATSEQGLVCYQNGSLIPFGQPANPWLIDKGIYYGCQLPDGRYALGTLRGGVAIINNQGQIVEIINKATGLQDETISYLYPDNQGHLWLALYNGISKVDIASPISFYNERLGLEGEVKAKLTHKKFDLARFLSYFYYARPPSESTGRKQRARQRSEIFLKPNPK